jgi:hypothetical protein
MLCRARDGPQIGGGRQRRMQCPVVKTKTAAIAVSDLFELAGNRAWDRSAPCNFGPNVGGSAVTRSRETAARDVAAAVHSSSGVDRQILRAIWSEGLR